MEIDNINNINRPYPYICFKISSGKLKYPVIGLFVNKQITIDIMWENFISLLQINDKGCFLAKKVSFYNECGRDVIMRFKPEKDFFSFYVGHYRKELNNPSEAEYFGNINSLEAGFEAERFGYLAEKWIDNKVKKTT